MKIVIVNTSDAKGGAAVVSRRLLHVLTEAGADAKMLVANRTTADPLVEAADTRSQARQAFLSERIGIWLANGLSRRNLFKVSTASCGLDVAGHPWVREADIVCLNWINQGLMSLSEVERIGKMGKRIVWTMHDMWCATGICHHAYDCRNYAGSCGRCQFIRFPHAHDLSRRAWEKKRTAYDRTPIHFVAVSHWLADRCKESSLLSGKPLSVIPNALLMEQFDWRRAKTASPGKKVAAMGAARLDDPVKGFPLMIEAVNRIADTDTDTARSVELLLFGDIRDKNLLRQIRIPYRWIGPVAPDRIPEVYRECDIVISSSHFETLPTTLAEGLAAGCLAVAFDHGGQSDIITHLEDGYLAAYPDSADLAAGILWAAGQTADRKAIRDKTAARFSGQAVASAYISLFTRLLSGPAK